jgi:hypothetical protein
MGTGGARRVLWGGVAMLAVLVPARMSAAAGGHDEHTVLAGVTADGAATGLPPGWTVEHPHPGVYRIVGRDGELAHLDVVRWDAIADVTILPQGRTVREVHFTAGAVPVDTAFSLDATLRR